MTVADHARDPRPGDPIAQVLVVCHANIARSPLAMALFEDRARRRLGPAPDVWVRSAGVRAMPGQPAAAGSRAQATARGLDLEAHRSAPLTRVDLVDADLVVTMSERQRGHAVRMHPGARYHTFTLPELARLCDRLPPVEEAMSPRARVRAVAWAASQSRPFAPGPPEPEDVADPFGGPEDDYERMAQRVEAAVDRVAEVLFRPAPTPRRDHRPR